ncbi:hypothetical protein ACRTDU_19760 [Sunxiuqinia elliptica]|uniref:SNARE associated Golgi protein n=1 Tax=Sunxiuqinia elliptica TaxID=655355 RepID=A0A1I2D2B9_9BACT|nr:hypothetical protein [Sunxiuqinia elliptica]SFE74666.1 hypothetical protein SAMN05216283_101910 [Sunxiuqinia elliptica]
MNLFGVVKLIHVFLLASVKYFITFPYALLIGIDEIQAIVAVTFGGIFGFFFFYYLSSVVIRFLKKHKDQFIRLVCRFFKVDLSRFLSRSKTKSSWSIKKRRMFIRFRDQYGFAGIIVTTPILLSIPVGAFLLNRYYSGRKYVMAYMTLSILGWALLFSAFVVLFPKVA